MCFLETCIFTLPEYGILISVVFFWVIEILIGGIEMATKRHECKHASESDLDEYYKNHVVGFFRMPSEISGWCTCCDEFTTGTADNRAHYRVSEEQIFKSQFLHPLDPDKIPEYVHYASPCCESYIHPGGRKQIRKSRHIACNDHSDGRVYEGDVYEVTVYSCWKIDLDGAGLGSAKWKYEDKKVIEIGKKHRRILDEKAAEVRRLNEEIIKSGRFKR